MSVCLRFNCNQLDVHNNNMHMLQFCDEPTITIITDPHKHDNNKQSILSFFSFFLSDGSGSSVRIPSVLISANEGQKVIDSLQAGKTVLAELLWDMPNEDVATVDGWISPAIGSSVAFLQGFASYARLLKYHVRKRGIDVRMYYCECVEGVYEAKGLLLL